VDHEAGHEAARRGGRACHGVEADPIRTGGKGPGEGGRGGVRGVGAAEAMRVEGRDGHGHMGLRAAMGLVLRDREQAGTAV
jgi:hypothetical protein